MLPERQRANEQDDELQEEVSIYECALVKLLVFQKCCRCLAVSLLFAWTAGDDLVVIMKQILLLVFILEEVSPLPQDLEVVPHYHGNT